MDQFLDMLRILYELSLDTGARTLASNSFAKTVTGRGPVDYIIDVRMGVAARMLVDTTTSVSEICYACGFNNLSNFNRIFKAKKGISPREFRQIYKKTKVIV